MYTKGPWKLTFEQGEYLEWKIEALSNSELVDRFETDEDGKIDVGTSRQNIELASRLADEPIEELAADMRLMASSPELLESCMLAFQELKKQENPNQFLIKHLERSIRRALKSDVDIQEVYNVLEEQNSFDYKEYRLVELDNRNFLFDIEFARNIEEKESYYSFVFDASGNLVEELYELSDDIEYHNLKRIKDEFKKTETNNLNKVSKFLRCNMAFLKRKDVDVTLYNGKFTTSGNLNATFFFENEDNGYIHYFENKELDIRKFYIQNQNEVGLCIELSKEIFADFDALASQIEQKVLDEELMCN